jgi:hypothetical protein
MDMGNESNLICGLVMLFCGVISFAVGARKAGDSKRKWQAMGVMDSSTGSWLAISGISGNNTLVAAAFVSLFTISMVALIRLLLLLLKNNARC